MTNVLNIDTLEFMDIGDGKKFAGKLGRISPALGAKDLSYNITVIPPGKRAFPYHRHHAIEEMFLILEGEGTLRLDGKEIGVKKGDVMAFPAGPGAAHQLINSGKKDLKFLAISTNRTPDVVEYPDSGKVGAMAGDFTDPKLNLDLRLYAKKDSGVDYFDGEGD